MPYVCFFRSSPPPAPHETWANQNSHSLRSCQEPLSELAAASHAIYTHIHKHAHKSPSPPSGAVAALGPFLRGMPRACPLRKAWEWDEGMKLVLSPTLALPGSSRHSGGRFNDLLRPCSPRPGSSGRLSVTRVGSGGE